MDRKIWSSGDKLLANDLNESFRFGGDGSDGELDVSSGTTTIDLGSESLVVKQYTSINISSGATLDFSNPHTNGTLIILRSQGNATIEGTIDVSGIGAAGGEIDSGEGSGGSGNQASTFLLEDSPSSNGKGGGWDTSTSSNGGDQYLSKLYTDNEAIVHRGIFITPGSGGGAGGSNNDATGGNGGRGGGALYIEVGKALDFTGTINVNGEDGEDSNSGSSGLDDGAGGGGGSAGMAVLVAGSITAETGTINSSGGDGGDADGGGGSIDLIGGSGAGSLYGAGGDGNEEDGGDAGGNGAGAGGGGYNQNIETFYVGGIGGASSGGLITTRDKILT